MACLGLAGSLWTLEVYRLDGGRYHLPRELSGEARFEPKTFPGLVVELRDLWL